MKKHVIRFTIPLRDEQNGTYPMFYAYVKRFQWPDRRSTPSIDWTPRLSEALAYADYGAARCTQGIIKRKYTDAHIHGVTDKEIFKAKLQDR